MLPDHVGQAEITMKIAEVRQRPSQTVQELFVVLNKLEDQVVPNLTSRERRTHLFVALHEHLRSELVRYEKPSHTREELEESAISLEKLTPNPLNGAKRGNVLSGAPKASQAQHSSTRARQKRKLEDCQAGSGGAKRAKGSEKRLRHRCYKCKKPGHLAKDCWAPKKRQDQKKVSKESEKGRGQ